MVVWLVEHLTKEGYHVGVISRGYGGNAEHAMLVASETPATLCGDEPKLIVNRTGCLMAVGRDRIAASNLLLDHANSIGKPIDVIVSDDGLQHYRLGRNIEIAVVDGVRRFGNGHLLPMGPLREATSRLNSVDLIVCNGGESGVNEHSLTLEPGQFISVKTGEVFALDYFSNKSLIAMAGIGFPQRFFDTLNTIGLTVGSQHGFVDHQHIDPAQLNALASMEECLLMTEKDAVKYQEFAQDNWFYLPVKAQLSKQATEIIFNKLKEIS